MLLGDFAVVRAHAGRRRRQRSAEYAAYRDEILFKQTVGRYAAAWHHVKPWYYFIVEVIPRAVAALEPAAVLAGAALQGGVPRAQCARVAAAVLGAARAGVLLGEPGQARHLHPAGVAGAGDRRAAFPANPCSRAPECGGQGSCSARALLVVGGSRHRWRCTSKFAGDAIAGDRIAAGDTMLLCLSRAVRSAVC